VLCREALHPLKVEFNSSLKTFNILDAAGGATCIQGHIKLFDKGTGRKNKHRSLHISDS
jgi:hypothetical protein